MDFDIFGQELTVKTKFSDKFNLIQMFRGINECQMNANSPVDFRAQGLQRKNHIDMWHFDIPLAFNTDEAIPVFVNGDFAGGNHGRCFGNVVTAPAHGKDVTDIASLWQDSEGTKWTLIRVYSPDLLMFVSENIGKSEIEYEFKERISGSLTYISHGEHKDKIVPIEQSVHNQVQPATKHTKKEVYSIKNGNRKQEFFGVNDCDAVEIEHEFELINQATMPDALRENRPEGGYKEEPYLAVGKPMLKGRVVYHIDDDGTVLVDFDYNNLTGVDFSICMGIMYQEKCNYGKGIYRYIPKQKPFEFEGVHYDFSTPQNTDMEPFPHTYKTTPDTWENPDSPPDRQIDFIKDASGNTIAAFAGGYLPVYDGEPSVRKNNIDNALMFYKTRKTYPTFKSGSHMAGARGVAYKKYFNVTGNVTEYRVKYNNETYVYIDFFAEAEKEIDKDAKIIEKSESVIIDNNVAKAKKGYLVYKI